MLQDYPLKRYSQWAGNPAGYPYNPTRCAYEVFPYRGIQFQCTRKPGHGPKALYCKQRGKKVEPADAR